MQKEAINLELKSAKRRKQEKSKMTWMKTMFDFIYIYLCMYGVYAKGEFHPHRDVIHANYVISFLL